MRAVTTSCRAGGNWAHQPRAVLLPATPSTFSPRLAPRLGPFVVSSPLGVATLAAPSQAAQELVVQLDGLTLPLDIDQLAAWARNPAHPRGTWGCGSTCWSLVAAGIYCACFGPPWCRTAPWPAS
jgi:hypothetical protein